MGWGDRFEKALLGASSGAANVQRYPGKAFGGTYIFTKHKFDDLPMALAKAK